MTLEGEDPFHLSRFVEAQARDYSVALGELRAGRKHTHWVWYVLPQLRGLGSSSMATYYGIGSVQEAEAYLAHPILGQRLKECVAAMNGLEGLSAVQVLGPIDAAKFQSCITLFGVVDSNDPDFGEALKKYFANVPDEETLSLVERPAAR